MKIALVYAYNTRDRRSFSGTAHYIACTLEKYCGEVSHLSPIPRLKEILLGKIINKITLVLFRKKFKYHCSFLLARRYASVTARRLAGQSFDVIIAPADYTEVAFLETDIPLVLVDDMTYQLLINYHQEFANLTKRSIHELHTIQRLAIEKASMAIFSSTWAAHSAIEDYGADPAKVHVVSFGANIDEAPAREDALARKPTDRCCLLFLAAGWTRKGGDIAFETLLKLEEMGIGAELIVCGCTPPQGVAHEHMKVVPFLDKNDEKQRKQLEQLLLLADFMLVPTRYDCTPISFCEASAFGLPVITTDTGAVSAVVRDGENGFLLPYEARGEAYAEVIARVYRDRQLYEQLVRQSRAAFEERLNWDAWGCSVQRLLANLLEHKQTAADFHVPIANE